MSFIISEKTEEIVAHSELMRDLFKTNFLDSGYILLPSVDISSGLDRVLG
jgi:hypothetical protein